MPDQPHLIVEACTGYTAAQPDAERAAYVERLSEKLRDPEFRKIEGFPIGDDEAILALSDPPYYTACPNPFLSEITAPGRNEDQRPDGLVLHGDRPNTAALLWSARTTA